MYKRLIKTVDFVVFGNIFIAICAGAMVQATYFLNGFSARFSLITFFIANSTFLLYNFHKISFNLKYTGFQVFFNSLFRQKFKRSEKVPIIGSFVIEFLLCFYIRPGTLVLLFFMAIPALLYSIPLFSKGNTKIKLRELLFFKMPLLAFVWAFSTVLIPAIDCGGSIQSTYVWLQFLSRFFFIFALCIPFEVRDIEFDNLNKIRTIPVVFGEKQTKWIGATAVFVEIAIHHFIYIHYKIPVNILAALDVSSLIALAWIVFENKWSGKYYYKLGVDGTMMLRFLLLLFFTWL